MRNWQETAVDTHLYYEEESGRIIGHLSVIPHTRIWVARVLTERYNDDIFLGQYINREKGAKSIEAYWRIQDNTLLEFNV